MIPYTLLFDGGCDPNPGAGYGSYQFTHEPSGRTKRETFTIDEGPVTNNEAEWLTLIQALHRFRVVLGDRLPTVALTISGDSQLVINQLTGAWNTTARFTALRAAALALLVGIGAWRVEWVRRDVAVAAFGH